MYQSHEDCFVIQCCLVCAAVDAGGFDDGSLAARLLHIDPCAVESAEIIDYGYHELEGVVCLQPQALKALNGIGG